jgi:hypothetical protein
MVERVSETPRASQWACGGSFYRGRGWDIDAPHYIEIKPWICENADSESGYNKSHMYRWEKVFEWKYVDWIEVGWY